MVRHGEDDHRNRIEQCLAALNDQIERDKRDRGALKGHKRIVRVSFGLKRLMLRQFQMQREGIIAFEREQQHPENMLSASNSR